MTSTNEDVLLQELKIIANAEKQLLEYLLELIAYDLMDELRNMFSDMIEVQKQHIRKIYSILHGHAVDDHKEAYDLEVSKLVQDGLMKYSAPDIKGKEVELLRMLRSGMQYQIKKYEKAQACAGNLKKGLMYEMLQKTIDEKYGIDNRLATSCELVVQGY